MPSTPMRETPLVLDLRSLAGRSWILAAALALAMVGALGLGSLLDEEPEARFRVNVVVEALPPLFGPPVLPGPFDYARLATSDAVVAETASRTGATADDLRLRLRAEPRVNSPEIDLSVSGPSALSIARAWESVLRDAAARETPAIERELVATYGQQLAQARMTLVSAAAAVSQAPDDPVALAELAAAEDNYETAARLVQSYDIVSQTMTTQMFTVKAPHAFGGGLGSIRARLAAGVAIGLVAGVIIVLSLDVVARRRRGVDQDPGVPPSLRSIDQRAGSSR